MLASDVIQFSYSTLSFIPNFLIDPKRDCPQTTYRTSDDIVDKQK